MHRPMLGPELRRQGPHHPNRGRLLLRRIPTCRRLPRSLIRHHDSILDSKVRSLQQTQGASDLGGADWRTAAPGEANALGDYVAKLGGAIVPTRAVKTTEGVAKEATLGAFKKARRDNRTPFQVLADLALFGDADDLDIWKEFETASRGRRAMAWSQGLRDRFDLGNEQTDEDIAAQENGTVDDTIFTVSNETWRDDVWPFASQLLDLAEGEGRAAVYDWLDRRRVSCIVPPVSKT